MIYGNNASIVLFRYEYLALARANQSLKTLQSAFYTNPLEALFNSRINHGFIRTGDNRSCKSIGNLFHPFICFYISLRSLVGNKQHIGTRMWSAKFRYDVSGAPIYPKQGHVGIGFEASKREHFPKIMGECQWLAQINSLYFYRY